MMVKDSKLAGIKIIQAEVFTDERGCFLETFSLTRYQEMLQINSQFVQDNHSCSHKNVLRGLHFQVNNPQGKLVRVSRGEVFDVVVDMRPDSATFGQWESHILNEQNKTQLWIPPGFAHGFLVLSTVADFEYKCTDYYDATSEACLIWNDKELNISWPITQPLLSAKDQHGKTFAQLCR